MNSVVTGVILPTLNPTMCINTVDVKSIPFPNALPECSECVNEWVSIARAHWDNFETSWDFRDQPLLRPGLKGATLEASWRNWEAACRSKSTADMVHKLRIAEEEADESMYWLELIGESELMKEDRLSALINDFNEIVAMVVASQKTLHTTPRK